MPIGYPVSFGGGPSPNGGDVISDGAVTFTTQTALGAGQWAGRGTAGGGDPKSTEPGQYHLGTDRNIYFVPDHGPADAPAGSGGPPSPAFAPDRGFPGAGRIHGRAPTSTAHTGHGPIASGGNDTLRGGPGADTLVGGPGSDLFSGPGIGDQVDGSEDPDKSDNDILDLFGSGWTRATTNILYADDNNEVGTVQFLDGNGAVIGIMTFSNIETVIPCFTPGTLIDTMGGGVAVEYLAAGDLVLTRDTGYQPVRWVGRRDLGPADLAARPALCPVRIRAGALGPQSPARDMLVSPRHRFLLTGAEAELLSGETEVLAAALHLLGRPGVDRPTPRTGISYIHILFDRHELVRSDSAWSESFQPGLASMTAIEQAQRDELLALFPELATVAGCTAYQSARLSLKVREARMACR